MGLPARFAIAEDVEGEPLVIRDLGPWDKHFTVTNGAEEVVERLTRQGYLPRGRRLLYYDSEGELDELVHDGEGRFLRFSPGPGRSP